MPGPTTSSPPCGQYFPDAVPSEKGTGSFIYTSPKTGKPTYWNPPGLDWGDWGAAGRMAADAVGGRSAGSAGRSPARRPGPAGCWRAGSRVPASAARRPAPWWTRPGPTSARRRPGTTSTSRRTRSATSPAGPWASYRAGHRVRGPGPRPLDHPAGSPETLATADRAGLDPTLRMVGRGAFAASETGAAKAMPFTRPERAVNALIDTAEQRVAQTRPDVPVPPGNVKEAAGQAGEALKMSRRPGLRDLPDHADRPRHRLSGRHAAGRAGQAAAGGRDRARRQAEVTRSPGVQGEALQPVQRWLERINADLEANNGALPVPVLRRLRTQLGSELDTEATTALPGPVQQRLETIYDAVRDDLYSATAQVSPEAAARLARHDAHVTDFRAKVVGRESPAGRSTPS